MKKTFVGIITSLAVLAQICAVESTQKAEEKAAENAKVSIKFYDKSMYYPGNAGDNPVNIHITIKNTGSDTLRFKLADDRRFSIDFDAVDVKNTRLEETSSLLKKRTTNQTVYFREIALEADTRTRHHIQQ